MADPKIYVAGHRGMVGGAILRKLLADGCSPSSIVTRTHSELDLRDASAVDAFFALENPAHVYLAAAKVGGIVANNRYPADFIRDNLRIETNVIDAAHRYQAKRLLFLGSSCIYPKNAPQPISEESLLTSQLEPTNRPYALAKIAGIEMCWSYNRQYGTHFLAAMPTNLYGVGDNYHPENSHVIPGLIRRFHDAKIVGAGSVTVWGTGHPRREFMFADDMANACVFLMSLPDDGFQSLLNSGNNDGLAPIINIGVGSDITIADLARMVAQTAGFTGKIEFDTSKPDGTPRKLLDSKRIRGLGWRPTVDLPDGLRRAYEDFAARTPNRVELAAH